MGISTLPIRENYIKFVVRRSSSGQLRVDTYKPTDSIPTKGSLSIQHMSPGKDTHQHLHDSHEPGSVHHAVDSKQHFSTEYQAALTGSQQHWNNLVGRAVSDNHHLLPGVQLTDSRGDGKAPNSMESETVQDIKIKGRNGHTDNVSGIKPREGETLAQLLKRLHPNLTAYQLEHQVKQVLKYNRDYGHDLGDGTHLDPTKAVFLTSVKYLDATGHITCVESPTGRLTNYTYDSDGHLTSYTITLNGAVIEQGQLANAGSWTVKKGDQVQTVKFMTVDAYGDLIETDQDGNQLAHLTSGIDVATTYKGNHPVKAVATKEGKDVGIYIYEYQGDTVTVYGIFPDNPNQRIKISQDATPEVVSQLAVAMGLGPGFASGGRVMDGDIPVDGFVAGNILRAAESMLGRSVTSYDSSVDPRVGCARQDSEALRLAGLDSGIVTANVDVLESKLRARGFIPVSEGDMRPGDVIIATGPGPRDGHCGIYAGNGLAYNNSTSQGCWVKDSYSAVFGGFTRRVAYRRPAA